MLSSERERFFAPPGNESAEILRVQKPPKITNEMLEDNDRTLGDLMKLDVGESKDDSDNNSYENGKIEISAKEGRQFSKITGNLHPIHRVASKKDTKGEKSVAIGVQVLASALGIRFGKIAEIPGVRMVFDNIKFYKKTYYGDDIEMSVQRLEDKDGFPQFKLVLVAERDSKNIDLNEDLIDDKITVGHAIFRLADDQDRRERAPLPFDSQTLIAKEETRKNVEELGRYLDEFQVGEYYACPGEHRFTEKFMDEYGEITNNWAWDEEYVDNNGNIKKRERVTDSMLLAVSTGQAVADFSGKGINPGYENVDLNVPVYQDDKLRTFFEVLEVDTDRKRVKAKFYLVAYRKRKHDYDEYGGNEEDGVVVGTFEREIARLPHSSEVA